jgi:hypothetical protein
MKNLSRLTLIGIIMLICAGWLINCKGTGSVNAIGPETQTYLRDVVYSDWINTDRWVNTRIFDLPARSFELSNEKLTTLKLENSEIYVYSKMGNSDKIHTLPYTDTSTENDTRFDYTIAREQTLRLVSIGLNGTLSPSQPASYRYVVVPKILPSKMSLNMNDYAAVQNALGLPE